MDFALAEASYRIDDPVAIEEPVSRWDLTRGYAFPVEGDGRLVGVVFVADGTWTIRFERQADARVAANRLAVLEDVPPESLTTVVEDQERVETFGRGYLLGNDVWSEVAPSLMQVEGRGDVLVSPAPDAAEEILVFEDRSLASARRIAARLLRDRVAWMRREAFDPGSLLVADLPQSDDLHARLGEFHTAQTWDRFVGETALGTDQHWLAYVRDPSGAFFHEDRAQILAQAVNDGRLARAVVARERFPVDLDGVRRAPHRVDLVSASATVGWDREGSGASLVDRVACVLRLVAVGGPAQLVWIDVPHVEQQPFGADPSLPNGFEFEGVSTAQGELPALHLPLTANQREGRGRARTYAVLLPEALPEGETLDLRVAWRDRHRFSHVGGRQVGTGWGLITSYHRAMLGNSTEPVAVLPTVRTHGGVPGPTQIRVGVRPWVAERDKIAVSGVRSAPFHEDGYRYVESLTTTSIPTMAIGQWDEDLAPAAMGLPAVRSLLMSQRPQVSEELPVEVRAVLNGWGLMLPRYPADEVQVAELYTSPSRMAVWLAGDGLVPIQPVETFGTGPMASELRIRRIAPHIERWSVAAALHAHWWSATGMPPGIDDLPRVLGTVYGIKTLGARFGPEVEDAWFDMLRVLSAPADRDLGYRGTAFALGRMLTDEIGDAALFEAVDRTLSGEFAPTLDGLQAALEASSGRELDGFFDLWIRASLAPRVGVSWTQEGDQLALSLTSDVPFASFEVPVRINGRGFARDLRVAVAGGSGEQIVVVEGSVRSVEVDPDRRMLLVRRGDSL
jgi:hypothetical protein